MVREASRGLPEDAPPAFLLDARRRGPAGEVGAGAFDNRSISLPTDFPSASTLRGRGIGRVILVQDEAGPPQVDLAHTLLRYQEAGIAIWARSVRGGDVAREIVVARPRWYRSMFQRFLATTGVPLEQIMQALPVGRLLRKDELCAAVRFLCGDDSRFVTGTTLVLDGGFTAM